MRGRLEPKIIGFPSNSCLHLVSLVIDKDFCQDILRKPKLSPPLPSQRDTPQTQTQRPSSLLPFSRKKKDFEEGRAFIVMKFIDRLGREWCVRGQDLRLDHHRIHLPNLLDSLQNLRLPRWNPLLQSEDAPQPPCMAELQIA